MLIVEVLRLSPEQKSVIDTLNPLIQSLRMPDNKSVMITRHFASKMHQSGVRPSKVAAMLRKALRYHGLRIRNMQPLARVVVRGTDRSGIVLAKAADNSSAGWILVTYDPTLNNEKSPVPELPV